VIRPSKSDMKCELKDEKIILRSNIYVMNGKRQSQLWMNQCIEMQPIKT